MTDKAKAWIRTLWPVLIGHLAVWLMIALGLLHIPVDSGFAAELAGFLAGGFVYVAGYELERVRGSGRLARSVRWLGRFLLSLGVSTGRPTYTR